MIKLSSLANSKGNSYDLILVIINQLIKIIYYKLVKVTIDALILVKVILDIIIWYYGFLNLIIINKNFLFILKFQSLLCYFFDIKYKLYIIFYF